MQTSTEERKCDTCENMFVPQELRVLGKVVFAQKFCFACVAKENTRQRDAHRDAHAEYEAKRAAAWEALCGVLYRTVEEGGVTEINRLRTACPKLDKILAWKLGPRGLLIHGETGRGKTRAAWRLLRTFFDAGRSIVSFTSGEFGRQYADAAGTFQRTVWFEILRLADIVFLDDLGKSEWTAGAWGEFFDLVENRMNRGRPTIVATNETGETLKAKAKDQNTWGPLYRRLLEFHVIAA